MKIVVVSDRQYGCGASMAAFRLARGLGEAGHQVRYCYFRPGDAPAMGGVIQHPLLPWRRPWATLTKRLAWKRDAWRFAWRAGLSRHVTRALLTLIARERPDVLNLHNVGELLTHRDVLELARRIPTFWTMHDAYALTWWGYEYRTRAGDLVRTPQTVYEPPDPHLLRELRQQVTFITPSRWLRQEMEARFPPGELAIHTVANGLDSREFHPEPREPARRLLGLGRDDYVLLFVASRLDHERKNLGLLVEAMADLPRQGVTLAALGRGGRALRRACPGVTWLGECHDPARLRQVYSAADLFVIPSLIDNLPNTVLESLFCGTPVAGAKVGGIPEMVRQGVTGWLFDPREPHLLTIALQECLGHRERLIELRRRTLPWVRDHFGIERQVAGYLALFRRGTP